jgi:hypothetical protein
MGRPAKTISTNTAFLPCDPANHTGHGTSVAGLLGILSVTGRLALTGAQRRVRPTTVVAAIFGLQALATASLPLVGGSRLGAVNAVTGFGLGFGAATIARPTLLAERYGTTGYATISGLLTVPVTLAKAGAPLAAAALLHTTGSYTPVWAAIGGCGAVAAIGMLTRASLPPPLTATHNSQAEHPHEPQATTPSFLQPRSSASPAARPAAKPPHTRAAELVVDASTAWP